MYTIDKRSWLFTIFRNTPEILYELDPSHLLGDENSNIGVIEVPLLPKKMLKRKIEIIRINTAPEVLH